MHNPLLKKVFWLFLLLFMLISIALVIIDSGLKSATTPYGIFSFQFCAYTSSCDSILLQWRENGQALAMLSLGLDYLYLMVYPGLIFFSLLLVMPRLSPNLRNITLSVAWSCPAISLSDAIENYASIQVILNQSANFYGLLAGIFASIKFTLLCIALSWLLFITMKYVWLKRTEAL